MSGENKPKMEIEEIVEMHILETDYSTGLDIRYIPIRIPKSFPEARYLPRIIYHNLNERPDKK